MINGDCKVDDLSHTQPRSFYSRRNHRFYFIFPVKYFFETKIFLLHSRVIGNIHSCKDPESFKNVCGVHHSWQAKILKIIIIKKLKFSVTYMQSFIIIYTMAMLSN